MKPWKMRIIFIVFGGNDFREDIYIMQMLRRYAVKMDFDGLTHEVDALRSTSYCMNLWKIKFPWRKCE